MMRSLDDVFPRLAKSTFRAWFSLGPKERAYLHERGMAVMLEHAADFVAKRLAPAEPPNDGKQTPMRGHPVFIAQHATATCCRACLAKWHGIPAGRVLSENEQRHILAAIGRWLDRVSAIADKRVVGWSPPFVELREWRGGSCTSASCRQRIALAALTPKRSAACRHDIPPSIAAITRSRRSNERYRPIHAGLLHQHGF